MQYQRKKSSAMGEENVPNENGGPEAQAIDAAYADHLMLLFKVLTTNLADKGTSHQSEQQCVDKFKAGLELAKRARQLALGAL
jgi:hypothetical protein